MIAMYVRLAHDFVRRSWGKTDVAYDTGGAGRPGCEERMPGPPTGRPPGTTSRTRDVQRLNPSHTDPIVTRAWYLWVRYGALYTQYVEKCSIAPQVGKRSCPHSNHDTYGVVHGPIEVHNAKQRTCPTARIDAPFVSTAIATSTQCPVASHWRSLTPPYTAASAATATASATNSAANSTSVTLSILLTPAPLPRTPVTDSRKHRRGQTRGRLRLGARSRSLRS